LLLGLLVFGRDGKMLTYAALLAGGAGAQGWLQRQHERDRRTFRPLGETGLPDR
jgi:hypothetical protein